MLRDRFGVSERRACVVVGQHRSTQRLAAPQRTAEEEQLREFLRDFSKRRPRWGWRRAAKAARKAGWAVNDKRIRQVWRDEGLKVPQKKRKKRLAGIGTHVGAMSPIRPGVLWALDFQFDVPANGAQAMGQIGGRVRQIERLESNAYVDALREVRVLGKGAFEFGESDHQDRNEPALLVLEIHEPTDLG